MRLHVDSRTGTGAARRWWQLAAVGTAVFCVVGDAAPTPAPVAVSTLMRRDLADFPGREALMLTVDYAPGA